MCLSCTTGAGATGAEIAKRKDDANRKLKESKLLARTECARPGKTEATKRGVQTGRRGPGLMVVPDILLRTW